MSNRISSNWRAALIYNSLGLVVVRLVHASLDLLFTTGLMSFLVLNLTRVVDGHSTESFEKWRQEKVYFIPARAISQRLIILSAIRSIDNPY